MNTQTALATDVGRKRAQNEDVVVVWSPDDAGARARLGTVLLVADGMGGATAGEVASRMAAETVLETYAAYAGDDPAEGLREGIVRANRAVFERAQSSEDHRGMGTTCTAVVLREDRLYFAHVGDSRAYLIRGGKPEQLTDDHSLIAQLVREKRLTQGQARIDPRRNVVTRSVGIAEDIEVDARVADVRLRPGDVVLVCSDGLHGQVDAKDIARITGANPAPERACEALVRAANEHGGPDNISVAMARVPPAAERAPASAPAPAEAKPVVAEVGRRLDGRRLSLVAVASLALIVAVGALLQRTWTEHAGPLATTENAPATPLAEPAGGTPPPMASSPAPAPQPAVGTPAPAPAAAASAAKPSIERAPERPSPATPAPAVTSPAPGRRPESVPAAKPVTPPPARSAPPREAGESTPPRTAPASGESSAVSRTNTASPAAPVAATGSLHVELAGECWAAQIWIDGQRASAQAPGTVKGLAPGDHVLELRAPDFVMAEGPQTFRVQPSKETRMLVVMQPAK